jgi:hypothetical protein
MKARGSPFAADVEPGIVPGHQVVIHLFFSMKDRLLPSLDGPGFD